MTVHLRRGALVAIDPRTGDELTTWAFQYNPETLTRQLLPNALVAAENEGRDGSRLGDRPIEEIYLGIELDAAEDRQREEPRASALGLLPALSALELLVYEAAAAFWARDSNGESGSAGAPVLVFVWGEHRRMPVRIAACTITEEAFDADLVPIRARIDLTLHVPTYGGSPASHSGRRLFIEYMQIKERLARR